MIIAEGTPETLAATPGSHTGEFLARLLPAPKAATSPKAAASPKPAAKKRSAA